MTVEEFAKNFVRIINRWPGTTFYVTPGNLSAAMLQALVPPGDTQQYPKMLYAGDFANQRTCVVQDATEESDALASGWSRTPTKAPPTKFPLHMVEIATQVQFTRGQDYRRVIIHNAKEQAIFERATNADDWTTDSKFMLGGRPISVDELDQEYKAASLRQLAEELQQPPELEPETNPDTVELEPQTAPDAPAGEKEQ